MPVQAKFTLQEMLQIALGAPELTNDNISILHSLIDIILKKLGCQNETITMGGFESKCMQRILKNAKMSPLAVNDEKLDILTERIDALESWEKRIAYVEKKLECHLEEIEKQYTDRNDSKWSVRFWEFYSMPLEDLCTTCEPENEIACSLLKNKYFMMKLLRRIAYPMVERIFALEKKIEELHHEFMKFMERMEEMLKKVALIDQLIIEVEKLRKEIHDHYLEFIGTMEEVQEMLDAKFDKLHVPAVKKFLKEKFDEISAAVNEIKKSKDCPIATGVIMENIQCLCCLNKNIGCNIEPAPILCPDIHKPFKNIKKDCGCKGPCLTRPPTLQERMRQLRMDEVQIKNERFANRSCRVMPGDADMEFLEGYDGNLYRKG